MKKRAPVTDRHVLLDERSLLPLIGHNLHNAFVRIAGAADDVLKQGGLSSIEFAIMALLLDNHRASQKSVSRTLAIDPANLANLLHGLEDRRLVRRVPDRHDKRVRGLELTAQGRQAARNALKMVTAREREFLKVLSSREARTLARLLRKLVSPR